MNWINIKIKSLNLSLNFKGLVIINSSKTISLVGT